ncbi:hypothetical protein C1752_13975 [Acaryochloris thomasi RCC1774]|uniref:Uncharacterized protein n=1 Tax=Acaryochloris thomasi RCC1774 TaxID=1764569 RepID=A0A2W1JGN3_9CYAN|nr:hypothetical protein C1752_13975 [Acaryochloris thomasi RCC1774]
MIAAALIEFRAISLNPPINSRVINFNATLKEHLCTVLVAQAIAKRPAYCPKNEAGRLWAIFIQTINRHN